MDPKTTVSLNPEDEQHQENHQQQTLTNHHQTPLLLPTASISLSLSTLIPSHLIPPKPLTPTTNPPPSNLKIPSQIASLSTISITSAPSKRPLSSKPSNLSSTTPLQSPQTIAPLRHNHPSGAAALRRSAVVWLRNDLRVHDNEALTSANNDSISVLPLYCFDPRDYGKSTSGFDKTGPFRANFIIQSVANLRENLRSRGSDLVVRMGRPEDVLLEMVKATGADAVYMHREVSCEDVKAEEKVEEVMKNEGVEVKYYWGSTLYHLEDVPFELDGMPTTYGGFKEKVKNTNVRKTIEALDKMKGLPRRGGVEVGEIPTLVDLGLNPNAVMGQNGKTAINSFPVGGETEALQRLTNFAAECKTKATNGSKIGANDSIYGANFSCKISPWLTMGCLSPRFMFEELKKSASSVISAASKNGKNGDTGMNWLMYELLWRDFFRFITRKYSSAKQQSYTPVTACTGAAA